MNHVKTAIGGFAAGAAFMYFADPNRGRRRRAVTRDKIVAGWHDLGDELDKAGRDLRNRGQGLVASVRSLWYGSGADEPVLVERVRSRIGRAVSHPHAVTVRAEPGGRIILEGLVLEHELEYLLKAVRAVPGVSELANRLEVHSEPGNVYSLQGGTARRRGSELAQENWTPALRTAAGALAGAALYAGLRNQGAFCWTGTAAGAILLARAVANRPVRQIFGLDSRRGAVDFEKTMHIDASVEEVFAFWSNFENFPRFMAHLKEVRDLGNGRSHWVAAGPAGISVPWDAQITRSQEHTLLAWKSVPASLVDTEGTVRFDPDPDGTTRVTIRMSYSPPAGVFGHAVAALFGADAKSEIDDDMVRLKSLIEIGKTRAHHTKVLREEIPLSARN